MFANFLTRVLITAPRLWRANTQSAGSTASTTSVATLGQHIEGCHMACDLKATQQLKANSIYLKQTQQLQQHARKPVEKTQEIKMKWERSNEKAMHKTTRNSPVYNRRKLFIGRTQRQNRIELKSASQRKTWQCHIQLRQVLLC